MYVHIYDVDDTLNPPAAPVMPALLLSVKLEFPLFFNQCAEPSRSAMLIPCGMLPVVWQDTHSFANVLVKLKVQAIYMGSFAMLSERRPQPGILLAVHLYAPLLASLDMLVQ